MQEKQTQKQCQNSGCSAADFLARLSALQDPEKDSEIHAALSSLNWPAWLEARKPPYLLFENVVGLINHDHCRTFATILNTLDRLGYGVEWQCLNSKDFGVPSQETACTLSDILMNDVEEKYFLSPKQQEVLLFKPTAVTKENESTPRRTKLYIGCQSGRVRRQDRAVRGGSADQVRHKTGYQLAQVGDSIDLSYATVNSRRGRVGKEIAHTLTTGCQQGTVEVRPVKNPIKSDLARNTERTGKPGAPMHTLTTKDRHGVLCEGRIRRLTPRECLRLQGWADDRIDTVLAIQSDNQAYKQAGNGVTVHVVEAIGRRIAAMDAELRGEALAP